MLTIALWLGTAILAAFGGAFHPFFHQIGDRRLEIFPAEALPTISGYFPVGASSRMFYAFYEAIDPAGPLRDAPIILWLQGGPGCSSMTGNFYEFGPWRTAPDLQLHRNDAPWNRRYGILFLDSPVGTGYSIAKTDEEIPVDQDQVARHLHESLLQFFALDESFKNRPFFVAGESYAGKYVPALGHYLLNLSKNATGTGPIRLDGLIIGNGLTHPIAQVQTHAATAYSLGLLDAAQRSVAESTAGKIVELIESEDWNAAYESRTRFMDWIENATGIATMLDVRRSVPYHRAVDGTEFLELFLNRPAVKAALRADDTARWEACSPRVRKRMANDTMKSVLWMVEDILGKVPVMLFQGLYDIKDGVAATEEWLRQLRWADKAAFFEAEKDVWRVDNAVAGQWRSYGNVTHVVVYGAGHMVAADQSRNSQQMVERWVSGVLHVA